MSTTISMQIGALTAQRTFQNDQKAANIVSEFYLDYNLGDENATNQQKLLAVIDWFCIQMQTSAKTRHMQKASDAAMAEAEDEYDLGGPV